jgi:uncharacterized protein DUF6458
MGIGVSLFLLAVGAILTFAVDVTTEGFNLDTIGVILMIVGGLGLLLFLTVWGSWGPDRRQDRIVTREREVL